MQNNFLKRINLDKFIESYPTEIVSDNYIVKGDKERIYLIFKSFCFSFVEISLWDNRTISLQSKNDATFIDVAIESQLGQEILNIANQVNFTTHDYREEINNEKTTNN